MKKYLKEQGLSIAELCISICLLATVVMFIMGIICGGITGIRKGEKSFTIGNLIKTELEYYSEEVLYDFDNINYSDGQKHMIKDDVDVDGVKIKEEWISFAETEGADCKSKLKEVTVSVYWYDKGISGTAGVKHKKSTMWISNYLD